MRGTGKAMLTAPAVAAADRHGLEPVANRKRLGR